ncbi:MAG: tetratricopeptide repeat protein [Elusimicrobiales bacterium]
MGIKRVLAAALLLCAAPRPAPAAGEPVSEGCKAMLARDYTGAAALFGKAAAAGDAEGEVGLGFLHNTGLGVPLDTAKAVSLYSKAAAKKYPKGLYYLARAHKNGQAGKRDYARAMALFKEAAAAGYPTANMSVGIMYRLGEGVKADPAAAKAWLRKAVKAGAPGGVYTELGQLSWRAGDPAGAVANYRKATENGELEAASPLGYMLANGQGIGQDRGQAAKLYRLSAENGFSNGQYNLGTIYFSGYAVPRDKVEALKWMLLSARSEGPGNRSDGLAAAYIPKLAATLGGAEIERAEAAAAREYPLYRANHDAWNAERFCRDESPHLSGE